MTTPTGVHPVADLFPMLATDELKELAEDIAARGLLQPIVLDAEGRVLDGRNRLAACELAGIEPTFETFAGDDLDGYAWSVNVRRRNLTKAQVAVMAAARFADKNLSTREIAAVAGVSQPMIVWAQAVGRYRDLRNDVLDRAKPLADAYAEAQTRDAAEARRQADISRLRDSAADLLALVDDERMSLDDAIAALEARELKAAQEAEAARLEAERLASEEERQRKERAEVEHQHAVRVSDSFRSIVGRVLATYHTDELRADVVKHYADDLGNAMPAEINADTIREAGEYLLLIADEWKDVRP